MRTTSFSEWSKYLDCRSDWWVTYILRAPRAPEHASRRLGSIFEVAFAARLRRWARDEHGLGDKLGPTLRRLPDGTTEERPAEVDPDEAIRRLCSEREWAYHPDHGTTEEAGLLARALVGRAWSLLGFAAGRFRPVVVAGRVAVQVRLEAPLPFAEDGYARDYYSGVAGILDAIVLDGERDWRPVIADTKVRGGLSDVDLGADPQLALYQHLAAHHGVRAHLCEQWGLLDKLPVEPPQNAKDRKVSRAAEHAATEETYREACRKAHQKPDEDHCEKLRARRWHLAVPGGGTDAEVARTVRELTMDAEVMAALALTADADWPGGEKPITRNSRTWAGAQCLRCDHRGNCHETKSRGLPLAAAYATKLAAPIVAESLEDLEREGAGAE